MRAGSRGRSAGRLAALVAALAIGAGATGFVIVNQAAASTPPPAENVKPSTDGLEWDSLPVDDN